MAEITKEEVEAQIKGYIEPHMKKNLIEAKCVKGIDINNSRVKLTIELGFPADGAIETVAAAIKSRVESIDGVS